MKETSTRTEPSWGRAIRGLSLLNASSRACVFSSNCCLSPIVRHSRAGKDTTPRNKEKSSGEENKRSLYPGITRGECLGAGGAANADYPQSNYYRELHGAVRRVLLTPVRTHSLALTASSAQSRKKHFKKECHSRGVMRCRE